MTNKGHWLESPLGQKKVKSWGISTYTFFFIIMISIVDLVGPAKEKWKKSRGSRDKARFSFFRWYLLSSPYQVLPVVVESCSIYQTTRLDLFLRNRYVSDRPDHVWPPWDTHPATCGQIIYFKATVPSYIPFDVVFFAYQYQISLLVVWPHIDCPWLVILDHFDEI